MFCPSCNQSLQAQGLVNCPICGFCLGSRRPAPNRTADIQHDQKVEEVIEKASIDVSVMDSGVRKGLNLVLISIAFLPVYKILAWLYPSHDFLINGVRSVELFERGGQAILIFLFVAGFLRVISAFTIERRRKRAVDKP